MMFPNYIKMAMSAIRASKWRSFLTMLGIIVGVSSVVTIVSLGEGVKRDVTGQISHLGPDLVTIRSGKVVSRDQKGNVDKVNVLQTFASGTALSENELSTVRRAPGVGVAVPFSAVSGLASVEDREYDQGYIVGTTQGMPEILNQKVEFGGFFGDTDENQNVAVIGKRVAERLLQENAPVGRTISIHGMSFIVRGVFEEFDVSPLAPNTDYNSAIFIPFDTAKKINDGQAQIQQILAKPAEGVSADTIAASITGSLKKLHGGQEDFTILRQQDNLAVANKVVNLLTGLISAVAAISLIVGGIGIMNIMLVSVTERTQEIGVRKAIGATNGQVLGQFVVEAAMISFVGGLLGVIVSLFTNYLLRVTTELGPVITWQITVLAVGVALVVGIVFGVAPALKAARKDPIEALRKY